MRGIWELKKKIMQLESVPWLSESVVVMVALFFVIYIGRQLARANFFGFLSAGRSPPRMSEETRLEKLAEFERNKLVAQRATFKEVVERLLVFSPSTTRKEAERIGRWWRAKIDRGDRNLTATAMGDFLAALNFTQDGAQSFAQTLFEFDDHPAQMVSAPTKSLTLGRIRARLAEKSGRHRRCASSRDECQ